MIKAYSDLAQICADIVNKEKVITEGTNVTSSNSIHAETEKLIEDLTSDDVELNPDELENRLQEIEKIENLTTLDKKAVTAIRKSVDAIVKAQETIKTFKDKLKYEFVVSRKVGKNKAEQELKGEDAKFDTPSGDNEITGENETAIPADEFEPPNEIKNESYSFKSLFKYLNEDSNFHKRDITSSTKNIVSKSHPKSQFVLDLEKELFDIDQSDVKTLPIKAITILHKALLNILTHADDVPGLRQALRKVINLEINQSEKKENSELSEQTLIKVYKEYINQLSEAKASRFNYKIINDIEPNKVMNPFFVQILTTFDLLELNRQQKQGILYFLKKLAELADNNPTIAQSLNRIIKIENSKETPPEEV